jgi:outer membrane protein assembly factor BamE
MTASLTLRLFVRGLTVLLLGASLAGCGNLTHSVSRDSFKPFVPEVVQGNFVSSEQRLALRPGMARAQVREILGTPLIASLFHADRWDYAFSIQRQGVAAQNFRLTVYFKGDVLEQVDSDVLPSESEFAGRLVRPQSVGKLPPLQASEEDLKKFTPTPAARAQAPSAAPAPAALPRSYPPLEPAVR